MVNDLLGGITRAIYGEFGDGYKLYTDDVDQNLKEPCFVILLLSESEQPEIMDRGRLHLPFAVHYIPRESSRKELHAVSERLRTALKTITGKDGPVRGVNLHSEISDGVLVFMVDYNLFTVSPREQPAMEHLTAQNNVKG